MSTRAGLLAAEIRPGLHHDDKDGHRALSELRNMADVLASEIQAHRELADGHLMQWHRLYTDYRILADAINAIASCHSVVVGDVVDIARKAQISAGLAAVPLLDTPEKP